MSGYDEEDWPDTLALQYFNPIIDGRMANLLENFGEDAQRAGYSRGDSNDPDMMELDDPRVIMRLCPHPRYCDESALMIEQMRQRVEIVKSIDPSYLNAPQKLSIRRFYPQLGFVFDVRLISPIHHIAAWGHIHCLNILLDAGAQADLISTEGFNAIHYAIYNGCIPSEIDKNNQVIKELLRRDVPIIIPTSNFYSKTYLLDVCIIRKNNEILKLLLERGYPIEDFVVEANGEICSKSDYTPVAIAVKQKNMYAFAMLLFYGAQLVWYPQSPSSLLSSYDSNGQYSFLHTMVQDCSRENLEVIQTGFRIYKEFGGNMWCRDRRQPDEENQLSWNYCLDKASKCDNFRKYLPGIEEMVRNPLSLQSMCRVVVKNVMGRKYWCNIDKLPVSRNMEDFLRFKDLEVLQ